MSFMVIGESLLDDVQRDHTHTTHPGGSPLNVALGLARLERSVTLVTRIGNDDAGTDIAHFLTAAGVKLYPGSIDNRPTSVAHAQLDEFGNASYTFDLLSDYPMPRCDTDVTKPRLVHIGSIGAHQEPGATTLRKWLECLDGHSTVSYDPNVRMALMGPREKLVAEVDELMPYIDVVKASIEDMKEILGPTTPEQSAKFFLERGAQLVVITRGAEGLNLATPEADIHAPAVNVGVVDTVGAGDALMAALIDGLARMSVLGDEDGEALRSISRQGLASLGAYAAAAAGITVGQPGSHLPSREELAKSTELYSPDNGF
ncbi:PfkB family carbohydrate kinase [Arcanobacterium phocae]|uniref:PfkB family carbohydrate kinase n=1 Tax=Arcanobacterium phocae TaxID=131112 RepID=UPI001C0EAB33|nr:PfkB family carbohydrate kinase [Arcanobacterium phocae]